MVRAVPAFFIAAIAVMLATGGMAQPVDPYQSGDRPLSWEMYRQRQIEQQVEMQRQQLEIRRQQLKIQEEQLEIQRQLLELEQQREQIERDRQMIEPNKKGTRQ